MPRLLVSTRERLDAIMNRMGRYIGKEKDVSGYFFAQYWLIWVCINPKVYQRRSDALRTGHLTRNMGPVYDWISVKPRYLDYLETLIHELVHVRFKELKHGPKFNKRIMEIAEGMRFPDISRKELMTPRPF
jgi:hypothetical protein